MSAWSGMAGNKCITYNELIAAVNSVDLTQISGTTIPSSNSLVPRYDLGTYIYYDAGNSYYNAKGTNGELARQDVTTGISLGNFITVGVNYYSGAQAIGYGSPTCGYASGDPQVWYTGSLGIGTVLYALSGGGSIDAFWGASPFFASGYYWPLNGYTVTLTQNSNGTYTIASYDSCTFYIYWSWQNNFPATYVSAVAYQNGSTLFSTTGGSSISGSSAYSAGDSVRGVVYAGALEGSSNTVLITGGGLYYSDGATDGGADSGYLYPDGTSDVYITISTN